MNTYKCNCIKYPGYEYSDDGKQCLRKIDFFVMVYFYDIVLFLRMSWF